jgi:hypothetical protein
VLVSGVATDGDGGVRAATNGDGDVRAAPAQGTGGGWQRQGRLWLEAMKAGAM